MAELSEKIRNAGYYYYIIKQVIPHREIFTVNTCSSSAPQKLQPKIKEHVIKEATGCYPELPLAGS